MFQIMPALRHAASFQFPRQLPRALLRFRRLDLPSGGGGLAALRPGAGARRLARSAFWGGVSLAGAGAALWAMASAPAPAPAEEPQLTWIDIQKPFALYDVNLPGLQKLDRAYEARRHATGGGRRDRLAFGRLGDTPYLRFEVYRVGEEAAPVASLHVAAARRASDIGYAVTRSGAVGALGSRFGLLEIADVTIERGRARQHCLAFQKREDADVVRLTGLSCDAGGVAPSRQTLACQIDQIQLMAAGEDSALRAAFVAADQRAGASCGPDRLAGVEPATRAAMAAEARAPKLRGTEAADRGKGLRQAMR